MEKTVVVALSGGVDSSMAAYFLSFEHAHLFGASHIIASESKCCNLQTLGRARQMCARLGIPYITIDLRKYFNHAVIEDFVDTYVDGKTPNPCVRCNEKVRFDAFYDELVLKLWSDGQHDQDQPLYFATGHYVRKEKSADGLFLKRAVDREKDQSYMLYRVSRDRLPYLLFPLGDKLKRDVVEKAKELGFPSASVHESQDICFVENSHPEFLKENIEDRKGFTPGDIVDRDGNILGEHRGYLFYTIGQRKGLGLGNGPWYVSSVDAGRNKIVVARREELNKKQLSAGHLNWFFEEPHFPFECLVNVRYQSADIPCTVSEIGAGMVNVDMELPATVSPGQSAVFYKHDLVIGGGIILN